jgi:hypothetical protein
LVASPIVAKACQLSLPSSSLSVFTALRYLPPVNLRCAKPGDRCRKSISIAYSECVFVALGIQHAMPCAIVPSVTCPALQHFYTLYHKRHHFRKTVIQHKMCVLIFSTTFVWNIFVLRRIKRDRIKNKYWAAYIGLHILGCIYWAPYIGLHILGSIYWAAYIGLHILGCIYWALYIWLHILGSIYWAAYIGLHILGCIYWAP